MAKPPAKPAGAKKDAAAAKPGDAADAPKSNKKKLIMIAALGVAIAGGAGWYFMKVKNAGHAEEAKVEVHKEPKFIPLEAFTVNLQREEADQFLQVSITLKVMEPELEEKIKAVLPEIRSKLNLLLSSKRPSELLSVAGKKKLATEIAVEANNVLGIHNAPVAPVAAPPAVAAAPAAPAGEHEHHAEAVTSEPAGVASAPAIAAPAPVYAAPPAAQEAKGIVDVLFTSFIIQ